MSPLSPPVQAIIELFRGPLAELRFADVDAATLTTLARAAEAAASDVAEHEAQLAELRQIYADRQEALLVLAQRGLAYARVYAEHDEALSEQLARINLPRASKPRKASAKPASSEAPAEPSINLEGEERAEASTAEAATSALAAAPVADAALADSALADSALAEPAPDEPALEEAATAESALEPKRSGKGKRRSSASSADGRSSEASGQ
jgi:hypothetical protein